MNILSEVKLSKKEDFRILKSAIPYKQKSIQGYERLFEKIAANNLKKSNLYTRRDATINRFF